MPAYDYDIAIVGGGISGALFAWSITKSNPGLKVLILEAGPSALDANGNVNRQYHIDQFYGSPTKFTESPYPPGKGAPSPDIANLADGTWNDPSKSYFVYTPGSIAYQSTYERLQGGTVWHWLGTSLRFNANDFQLYTKYLKQSGIGSPALDWPIGYAELESWYENAESAIGVAANVHDQTYPQGPAFRPGYQYPMPPILPSYLDQVLAGGLNGFEVPGYNPPIPITVRSTPQGRNSIAYNGRPPCMGNTNCVPLCPIGAKYDPMVHLLAAMKQGVVVQNKSVAFNLLLGSDNKSIAGIQYKTYDGTVQPTITARLYIIAAHAVETPKLLLLSNDGKGIANSSDQVGRNLMDHNTQLSWALMPSGKPVFGYRGPISTCGIEDMRDGPFRATRGAFRIEIGNDGWNWPTTAPATDVIEFVQGGSYGKALRDSLQDKGTREFRVASLVEPIGDPSNRVQVSDTYTDAIGIPRPLVSYGLQDYEIKGLEAARDAAVAIFKQLGATDCTTEAAASPQGFFGAGHILGTARMGSDSKTSVTDSYGHTWDHPNLFIVGAPLFPSVSCVNPTLTIAAVTLRSADYVAKNWNTLAAG